MKKLVFLILLMGCESQYLGTEQKQGVVRYIYQDSGAFHSTAETVVKLDCGPTVEIYGQILGAVGDTVQVTCYMKRDGTFETNSFSSSPGYRCFK